MKKKCRPALAAGAATDALGIRRNRNCGPLHKQMLFTSIPHYIIMGENQAEFSIELSIEN
ncbi:MAG: hypothetical protein NC319_00280 [Butyricicoccus sp.]|nr:hypothetical protein [Butyricicoccus sp.]